MFRNFVNFIILSAVAILYCCTESDGSELEATLCTAKLPNPVGHAATIYDGDDSIYVFGG
jgi:hypothetical protein